jgi:hypothetical protein
MRYREPLVFSPETLEVVLIVLPPDELGSVIGAAEWPAPIVPLSACESGAGSCWVWGVAIPQVYHFKGG